MNLSMKQKQTHRHSRFVVARVVRVREGWSLGLAYTNYYI